MIYQLGAIVRLRAMDIFGKTEKYIAIVLLVLMGIVVIAAAAENAFQIVTG